MPSHQRYCCVCKNYSGKFIEGKKVSMHRFPADVRARRVWIQRCKNARPNFLFVNSDQTRLCSEHFIGRSGPKKENPLPSLFPRPDGNVKTYKLSVLTDESEVLELTHENEQIDMPQSPVEETSEESRGIPMDVSDSITEMSLKFHDYTSSAAIIVKGIRHQSEQVQPDLASVATQTENIMISNQRTSSTQTVDKMTSDISTQVTIPTLTFDDISNNDSKVLFYTGIPDAGTFKCLFFELEKGMTKTSDSGRPKILRLLDEFFMVLMRLRLGLLLEDLSDRFEISTSTCSIIFNRWIDYLDIHLQFLVKWPTRKNIDDTMPQRFRKKYPKCRVIIDCTEIRTETPCSLQLRSLLYSDYKSHMTYKSLIGISPAGIVTFVSDLYAGSTSDKQITKLSGLVDICDEGDAIMVDKGFLISDFTTPKGVNLIIPPFKQTKKTISAT